MSTTQVPVLERADLALGLNLVFWDDELISDGDEPVWID